jgi:hypothetical protein
MNNWTMVSSILWYRLPCERALAAFLPNTGRTSQHLGYGTENTANLRELGLVSAISESKITFAGILPAQMRGSLVEFPEQWGVISQFVHKEVMSLVARTWP